MAKHKRKRKVRIVYDNPAFARADGETVSDPMISTQPPTDAENLRNAIEQEYDSKIEKYPYTDIDAVVNGVADNYAFPVDAAGNKLTSVTYESIAAELLKANNDRNTPAAKTATKTVAKTTNWKKILFYAGIAFAVYYVFLRKGSKNDVSKIINIS